MDNDGNDAIERHFEVFADYFQVWLQDEQAPLIPDNFWTPEALARHVALAPGVVAMGTARNFTVPLDVVISGAAPELNLDRWDRVVEVNLDVPTGILVVMGCTDDFSRALRMEIRPGTYRVRVCSAGLDSISPNGLEGEDQYRAELWLSPIAEPTEIKSSARSARVWRRAMPAVRRSRVLSACLCAGADLQWGIDGQNDR